jgi:hypothetical protein
MKKIKIEFQGQSKSVVANVEIEYVDTDKTNEEVLTEVKLLYEEAYKYADSKTKQLNGIR